MSDERPLTLVEDRSVDPLNWGRTIRIAEIPEAALQVTAGELLRAPNPFEDWWRRKVDDWVARVRAYEALKGETPL